MKENRCRDGWGRKQQRPNFQDEPETVVLVGKFVEKNEAEREVTEVHKYISG